MGVRADVVSENAVSWQICRARRPKPDAARKLRHPDAKPDRAAIGALPILSRPSFADGIDRAIASIAASRSQALFQRNFNPCARLGGFRADMDRWAVSGPVLVIDLDRIVTHRNDQIRSVRKALHIGAPGAADNAGPVRVIFRQKTFARAWSRQKAIFVARRT